MKNKIDGVLTLSSSREGLTSFKMFNKY